jgi:hypothetical protein
MNINIKYVLIVMSENQIILPNFIITLTIPISSTT